MKEISELVLPEACRFTKDHEWARMQGDQCTIGIGDYAQDQLGDIVYVELPDVGAAFEAGDEFGTVESVKAVSELYIPVSGRVTAVNERLESDPGLVNQEPYTGGWMIKVKPGNPDQFHALMDKEAYLQMLKG